MAAANVLLDGKAIGAMNASLFAMTERAATMAVEMSAAIARLVKLAMPGAVNQLQ